MSGQVRLTGEIARAFTAEASRFRQAVDPLGPSLRWPTFADVWAALDVSEANRALRCGARADVVAEVLAARRLAREHGTGRVRDALMRARVLA